MQKIPVPKEDYRTNRADYLIAKSPKAEPKAKKRPARAENLRSARENSSAPLARSPPRH